MIRVRRRSLRPAIFRHSSGRPKSTAIFIANKSLPLCVGWFDANTEINQRGHVTAGAPLALIMPIYVICFTVELESSLINRVNKYEIARKLRKPGPQRNQFIRVYSEHCHFNSSSMFTTSSSIIEITLTGLTLWCLLLPYRYSFAACCARPG